MTVGATLVGLMGLCILLVYLPLVIWRAYFKRRSGPTIGKYSLVALGLMAGLGIVGALIGFFGPLALSNASQGPLLAFATGPLGVLIGMLSTWAWFFFRRNEP